ncbi:hypothetical protein B0J12DRAFT_703723 [Macrophomina phaseolina]|uniref:Uncharacterized protein n=1 Tax=Macrophomina phaseolina TaxID=35725 RepID=A0ABQ8FXR6_9PEZI|nr:hypothetical protein B0J12DRAFT_703723 [Macrophomina phaseolina]
MAVVVAPQLALLPLKRLERSPFGRYATPTSRWVYKFPARTKPGSAYPEVRTSNIDANANRNTITATERAGEDPVRPDAAAAAARPSNDAHLAKGIATSPAHTRVLIL